MDAMTTPDRGGRANLEQQLVELSKLSVLYVPRHDRRKSDRKAAVRHPDCFLTWPPDVNKKRRRKTKKGKEEKKTKRKEKEKKEEEKEARAITLGPYARWLIAADLLMSLEPPHEALDTVISKGNVKRVFMATPATGRSANHLVRTAGRYVLAGAEDDYAPALRAIIDRLDVRFKRRRGRAIDHDTFLQVRVPLSDDEDIIGDGPIVWFKQWLEWGVGKPSSASVRSLLSTESTKKVRGLSSNAHRDQVLLAVRECRARRAAHQISGVEPKRADDAKLRPPVHHRIVNVVEPAVGCPSALAVDVASALTAEGRSSIPSDPVSVMYVRLDAGASREKVLRQLYEAFYLDAARLQDLAHRPIDLSADLDPIRRALTVNSVVVIFDGWDNVGGPFGSFYEFLSNTHWGEFLRVLAQPHLGAEPGQLQGRSVLLVITARQALELRPWSRFIADAAPASVNVAAALAAVTPKKSIVALEDEVRQGQATQAWNNLVSEVVLRLVAACVNGLRRGTLERCLDHWIRLYWKRQVDPGIHCQPETLQARIKATVDRYPALLQEIDDEELEGLSSVNRTLELDRVPHVQNDAASASETPSQDEPSKRGRNGKAPASNDEESVQPARDECSQIKSIVFTSLALRTEFLSAWLDQEQDTSGQDQETARARSTCNWACINLVLAEESLRQGTSQLLHLPAQALGNPYAVRRILQTIYHGLQSLEQSPEDFVEVKLQPQQTDSISTQRTAPPPPPSTYGAVLPLEIPRRYRYLYTFLYRHVCEAGEWKLGRAYGRSDIKLAVLSMFVFPSLGTRLLAGRRVRKRRPAQIAPVLRSDPAMWCDLLEALGRAGLDLDQGSILVERVLKQLPGGADTAQTNALLPWGDQAYFRVATAALRLRVDWLQTKGKLDEAEDLCWKELARYGIDRHVFDELHDAFGAALQRAATAASKTLKHDFEEALHAKRAALIQMKMFPDVGESMSTILFRLGEILATRADDAAGQPDRLVDEIAEFAKAFAVFWIADRLRSESAGLGHADLRWPLSGSRVVRYYVRVCLKLARLLTKLDSGERLEEPVNWLLDLAHSRIGAYTRHHYRFRRDQILMLGLEAARVRAWVRIDLERGQAKLQAQHEEFDRRFKAASEARDRAQRMPLIAVPASAKSRPKKGAASQQQAEPAPPDPSRIHQDWVDRYEKHKEFLDSQQRRLDAAWALLQEAEGHLFALGYQSAHLRRVHLERIKTLKAFKVLSDHYDHVAAFMRSPDYDNPIKAQLPTYLGLRSSLLDAMEESSSRNAFWRNLVKRLRDRDVAE